MFWQSWRFMSGTWRVVGVDRGMMSWHSWGSIRAGITVGCRSLGQRQHNFMTSHLYLLSYRYLRAILSGDLTRNQAPATVSRRSLWLPDMCKAPVNCEIA
jgi:hypothetical protein